MQMPARLIACLYVVDVRGPTKDWLKVKQPKAGLHAAHRDLSVGRGDRIETGAAVGCLCDGSSRRGTVTFPSPSLEYVYPHHSHISTGSKCPSSFQERHTSRGGRTLHQ
jgi:hypothetical protein